MVYEATTFGTKGKTKASNCFKIIYLKEKQIDF